MTTPGHPLPPPREPHHDRILLTGKVDPRTAVAAGRVVFENDPELERRHLAKNWEDLVDAAGVDVAQAREWISNFATSFVPMHPDNEHFIGDYGVSILTTDERRRKTLLQSVDEVLANIPSRTDMTEDEVDAELAFRRGCASIRDRVRECRPPKEIEAEERETENERILAQAMPSITKYNDVQTQVDAYRLQRNHTHTDELINANNLRSLRGYSRVLRDLFKPMSPVKRIAAEETILKRVIQLHDRPPKKDKPNVFRRLYNKYDAMIRGVKLEYASHTAISDEIDSFGQTGWSVRESDVDEDVIGGMDEIITVPLSDGISEEIGLDVKSRGAFDIGVRDGKYVLVPGTDGRFAIKEVNGRKILVVNAEHEDFGGGLAVLRSVRVRRFGQWQTFGIESWDFGRFANKFAKAVLLEVGALAAKRPPYGEPSKI